MKYFSIYLSLLSFLFFATSVYCDEFYLMRGDRVELEALYQDGHSEKHALYPSKEVTINGYKKICAKSDNNEYEVGIKGNKFLSLKSTFSCIDYQVKKTNIPPPPDKIIFILEWMDGKMRLNSNTRKILIAEGRSGDAIELSLASFPSFSIDLSNNTFSRVELKLIKNKSLIYTRNISDNYIFIDDLAIKNIYLLKIYGEKDTIKMSQRFVITE